MADRVPVTATYRLQLRGGVGFAEAEAILPYLRGLGISHLFLSPVQVAREGSTHGYDITDPTRIDPVLGGRAGYSRLAAAARAQGMGLILDVVPNHMAFDVATPWLADVMRHGKDSRFARHFDIDWGGGGLLLPMLEGDLAEALAEAVVEEAPEGPVLRIGALVLPLAPGTELGTGPEAMQALHDAQNWRLRHWRSEERRLSHRRFFNVTQLIGVRVEEPAVFEDVHALIFELVAAGEVDGLRIDHIDGLADPAAYLAQLRGRVGDLPVWVEKILTGDEALRGWPVQGTTGYEAARSIARVLSWPDGVAALDSAWRGATGYEGGFAATLAQAKEDVLAVDLRAEVTALVGLATAALGAQDRAAQDRAALAAAVRALLAAFPRYRTYLDGGEAHPEDLALMAATVEAAQGAGLVPALARLITGPGADAAFRTRFQQVTGALTAKAHEDTAEFRFNRYLAANEVGSDPDEPVMSVEEFAAWFARRTQEAPDAMVLTSSHDTKRAEDARMRLVAMSHAPEDFAALWEAAEALPAEGVAANLRWYIVQSWLAVWEPGRTDVPDRLAEHVRKAMREAKEVTTHTEPDEAAEAAALDWTAALCAAWAEAPPAEVARLHARGSVLSLAQMAMKLLLPGVPDTYQGTEDAAFHLTDPDNRLPVDFAALAAGGPVTAFGQAKTALLRQMLALRAAEPELFTQGEVRVTGEAGGPLEVVRAHAGKAVRLALDAGGTGELVWSFDGGVTGNVAVWVEAG
ncbi:malto-oligosyltrehalose synthase [Frigidibacter albus]|uniref:Malto-oligosyltrehalose synthase n=1 Tax=Frigidibacter albus TaxID=1465486 RepID=A0A6L8VIT8_9RHOB|nr:malto-oligosyltrehalose synthase [Frigidibacter albus]MZQ89090.1 malto-oligosyltrehalose synthase [Frigidibacter albus]NBE30853.1 malto-oligosyltrehalose synthase [Frigidibacter albus]GGH51506.1 malto-oligosyltrehalose synthase [Frigidibacter albus]